MLDIDTVELKNNINNLNSLINEYEEIELNIFNQLKDSCKYWQDNVSNRFDNEMYYEKLETNLLIDTLKQKKELFNYIYNRYESIGKKIKCNLNNKDFILRTISDCCNQLTNIINSFNRIDMSINYSGKSTIQSQKQKMVSLKTSLSQIKRSTSSMYNKLENIEKDINKKIKELDTIKIRNFEFKKISI